MKPATFFLYAILYNLPLCAQNYQPFITHGVTQFKKTGYDATLYGAKFDSMGVNKKGDSVFYAYKTVQYSFDTCKYNYEGGYVIRLQWLTWLGFGMIKRSNDNFIFLNSNQDSILIKSRAGLNSSWTFYRDTDRTILHATITSLQLTSYTNFQDSIKVITLTKEDSAGNTIASDWNGKKIWLSKSHGLLRTPSFLNLPFDTATYWFFPPLVYPTEWNDAENVGDELDIVTSYNTKITTNAVRCIAKEYLNDSATVSYIFMYKDSSHRVCCYPDDWDTTYFKTYTIPVIHDTTKVYVTGDVSFAVTTDSTGGSYNESFYDGCLHSIATTSPASWFIYCSPGIYTFPFEPDGFVETTYSGVAAELFSYEDAGDPEYSFYQYISYYKSGSIECGDHSIINAVNNVQAEKKNLEIFPNPAHSTVTIYCAGIGSKSIALKLISISGDVIQNMNYEVVANDYIKLDLSRFPSGIYLLQMQQGNQLLSTKILKQ